MIRLVWSVLCRLSTIDKDSNALSLFEAVEQLNVFAPLEADGVAPYPTQLVTLWARSNWEQPTKASARVRLIQPDGTQRGTAINYEVDLTAHKRLRHRLNLAAFPIAQAGVYELAVDARVDSEVWQELARIPVDVVVREQPREHLASS